MTHSVEEIAAFHTALYEACGHEPMRMSMSDDRIWWDFLKAHEPLEDTTGGPLTKVDILAVVREMERQKKQGAGWSLRPITILRDPERFRDMVLESRRVHRKRPAATVQPQRTGEITTAIEHDPAAESDSRPLGSVLSEFLQEHKE